MTLQKTSRFLSLFLCFLLIHTTTTHALTLTPSSFLPSVEYTSAATEVTVFLDDTKISFDQPPVIIHDRVLVPVRAIAEQMGGTVTWSAATSIVSITLNHHVIHLTIGSTTAYLDGNPYTLDVAPQIIGNRTLMPIRFVAEAGGYIVKWYEQSKTVGILSEEPVLYHLQKSAAAQTFRNNLDGYRITLPSDFQLDLSLPEVRSLFTNGSTSLEIYCQAADTRLAASTYIHYTNKAILSHPYRLFVTSNRAIDVNGRPCTILEWHRDALSKIPNDKCYYYKADISDSHAVYTLFFKSSAPLTDFANSVIQTFSPTFATYESEDIPKDLIHGQKHSQNSETAAYMAQTFGAEAPLTWGVFEPTYGETRTVLAQNESTIGYHFPVLLTYTGILNDYNSAFVGEFLNNAWAENRVVELTLQNPLNDDTGVCYDVLNGKYDRFLENYAKAVADFSHPVLLRLFNEMNGDWCLYSAYQMGLDTDLYRQLYRYVAGFFERAGADNIIYVFNPNSISFPNYKWNNALLYYPGDEYADIWGLTAYNTGTYYSGESWQSFDTLYQKLYNETLKVTDMPLMITEFASAREGGNKEAWVQNMLSAIGRYPAIKVAVWWNHADFNGEDTARAYYMLDSQELVTIWRNYLSALQKN